MRLVLFGTYDHRPDRKQPSQERFSKSQGERPSIHRRTWTKSAFRSSSVRATMTGGFRTRHGQPPLCRPIQGTSTGERKRGRLNLRSEYLFGKPVAATGRERQCRGLRLRGRTSRRAIDDPLFEDESPTIPWCFASRRPRTLARPAPDHRGPRYRRKGLSCQRAVSGPLRRPSTNPLSRQGLRKGPAARPMRPLVLEPRRLDRNRAPPHGAALPSPENGSTGGFLA